MPRMRWTVVALAVFLIGAGGVGVAARALPTGDDSPIEPARLGGAELVAGSDGVDDRPTRGDRLVDLRLGAERSYNDFRAYDVRTDFDGNLYLLTGWTDCDFEERCYGIVARFDDEMEIDAVDTYADAAPGQLSIAPDGRVARIGPLATIFNLDRHDEIRSLDELPIPPLSGSYTADGTLVVSRVNAPAVVAIHPDRTVEHLLAPTSSPQTVPARFDSDTAALTVVALPDGRIALATNAPDDPDLDGRVYILDGEALQQLDLPEDTHPIRRIFPGPDGTLLALEGPHITQVDPDTATTNRLIDLSEVADELATASDEWPPVQDISATAHGDDLLFTAEYQLWRLPDVFE
jgi:hypothetical protein